MKRRYRLSALALAALLLLLLAAPAVSLADEDLWYEDYYRAYDSSKSMTEEERNSLDDYCLNVMRLNKLDLAVAALRSTDFDGALEPEAKHFYESCKYGYGESLSGFMFMYLSDTEDAILLPFGEAIGVLSESEIAGIVEKAKSARESGNITGVLRTAAEGVSDALLGGIDIVTAEDVAGGGYPSWYPEDPQSFEFFHDETAPRVVDTADILSADEEATLEKRIGEIRDELQRDIVIFTDTTTYGLEHMVYADDFFDFNGYGCGPDYEGVCLMVCMDPYDRGFWVSCSGPDTMKRYTEDIANKLDDVLYDDFVDGNYASGMSKWVEGIRTLYIKGVPFVPDWYPNEGEDLPLSHNADSPRVVDEAGLFTEDELARIKEEAAALSGKYGIDVAVQTAAPLVRMDYDAYSDNFYRYMGYGFGENYDGILLSIFKREGYYGVGRITAYGAGKDKLSDLNKERLLTRVDKALEDHRYYDAASDWLKKVDGMRRTGRVPKETGYWILNALLGIIGGSIYGGISLSRAKRRMKTPAIMERADSYLVDGGLYLAALADTFLNTTTERRYDPPEKSSSSSGSGGGHRSSYSSSHSSSSGRSHSGSGRRF